MVRHNEDRKQLIHQLSKEGLNQSQISIKIGISRSVVRYYLEHDERHKRHNYINDRRRFYKSNLIKYSGGKCVKCDYDVCNDALDFHHIDQNDKLFTIGSTSIITKDELINEVNKTLLICCRCHRELHAGLWTPDSDMILKQNQIRNDRYNNLIENWNYTIKKATDKVKTVKQLKGKFTQETKIDWPDNLPEMVANSSKAAVARLLEVSFTAVVKRLKNHHK